MANDSVLNRYRNVTVLAVVVWTLLVALLHPAGGAATAPLANLLGQQIGHHHHHDVEPGSCTSCEVQDAGTGDHTHEPWFLLPQHAAGGTLGPASRIGGLRSGVVCMTLPVPERPPKSLMA